MDIHRRGQTLCRLTEQAVSMETLPSDLSLVSRLRGTSILPIAALVQHRSFAKLRATESEIVSACNQSSILQGKIVYCPDACLVLPFFVDLRVLIVSNVPNAKQSEFREFISAILGHKYFEVHPYHQPSSFKTRFVDTNTSLCVWRALSYCAFKGAVMTATPLSSLVAIEQVEVLKPIPVHKKRASTSERKRRQRMRNARKIEKTDLPAVVPMADVIRGVRYQLPQAVCLDKGYAPR